MDNLSTHAIASVHEPFPPAEARRDRLDIHYTPRHGNWPSCLNGAEIDRSDLHGPRLHRRIPDMESMRRQTSARRNRRDTATTAALPSTGASQPEMPATNGPDFIRNAVT
jgi:hypothetical protein